MPDLLDVFAKRWKLIVLLTFCATLIALIFAFISPKQYLSVATALPANSVTADKARIFNQNIEALYSDLGSPDELDRFEGTAALDTIFIATSKELNLPEHYSMNTINEKTFKAALELKRNTKISRSSYGELQVKVWDRDRNMAAQMANYLMQKLQELHQHLQNESNVLTLEKIKQEYALKQNKFLQLSDSMENEGSNTSTNSTARNEIIKTKLSALTNQLQQYENLIGQYQLAVNTNAPVLLIVENARPSLWPDKPKILQTVLFVFFGALIFSFLLVLFTESRKLPV